MKSSKSRTRASSASPTRYRPRQEQQSHQDLPHLLQQGHTGLFDVPDLLRGSISRNSHNSRYSHNSHNSKHSLNSKQRLDSRHSLSRNSSASNQSSHHSHHSHNSKHNLNSKHSLDSRPSLSRNSLASNQSSHHSALPENRGSLVGKTLEEYNFIDQQRQHQQGSEILLDSHPGHNDSSYSLTNHNQLQQILRDINQLIKQEGCSKTTVEKAMSIVIHYYQNRGDDGRLESQILLLLRTTYQKYINVQIVGMLQDRETKSRKVLQLQAKMGLDQRQNEITNNATIESKLKMQSNSIKTTINESFRNTITLEVDFITDLIDRGCFEEANMFAEQCQHQYFPLLGNDWKDSFTSLIAEAKNGVRVATFQRKKAKQLVNEVDQILYGNKQGKSIPTIEHIAKLLVKTINIKTKYVSSQLQHSRVKLIELCRSSIGIKINLKWSTVMDEWRSSVASAKAIEAKNYYLTTELKVSKKGYLEYKKESEEWHKCYDLLRSKLDSFDKCKKQRNDFCGVVCWF
jgi:hypothetical protein